MNTQLKEKLEFFKYLVGDTNKHLSNYIVGLEEDITFGNEIKEDEVNNLFDIVVLKGMLYDGSEIFSHLPKYHIEMILELFPVNDYQRRLLLTRKNMFDNIDIIKNIKGDE